MSTPVKATETILKAALAADASAIAGSLSAADLAGLKYLKNSRMYSTAEQDKLRAEKEYKLQLGKTVDEYVLSRTLLELTLHLQRPSSSFERELFSRYVILGENIWDDKYAEVKFFVPYSAKGPVPPLIFAFIKEKGEWKFAQWLAPDMFLSGYGARGGLDRLVSVSLRTHAGVVVNRSDCSKLKSRQWKVPAAIDDYFEKQIKAASGPKQRMLWEFWLLSTSKKAAALAEKEAQFGPSLKALSESLPKLGAVCDPKEKIADSVVEKPDPALWFGSSQRDIPGLKNLIAAYPGEPEWRAKAELQIGMLYEGTEDRAGAEAKYKKVISAYPASAAMPEANAPRPTKTASWTRGWINTTT